VCGRTARTVRREGRARALSYPYQFKGLDSGLRRNDGGKRRRPVKRIHPSPCVFVQFQFAIEELRPYQAVAALDVGVEVGQHALAEQGKLVGETFVGCIFQA
jgi:hypothetical protein